MRIGFCPIGGNGWTGGSNYLLNLISAISEIPERPIDPVLFVGDDAPSDACSELERYLPKAPVRSRSWSRRKGYAIVRLSSSIVIQRDLLAEHDFRRENIDLVFQHSTWYGSSFSIPTLAWIADFQHRYLPELFSRMTWLKREVGYAALSRASTALLLSSESARRDCERFYPKSIGRTMVLPFVARMEKSWLGRPIEQVVRKYDLPRTYLYVPNQFWKHKNHLNLVRALLAARDLDAAITLAVSGSAQDHRHPRHATEVFDLVRRFGLTQSFRYLGVVPYEDVIALMRGAVGVVNPSLFEGWSTTVEEAKALGVPMLLSDLSVHREQAPPNALFFDPTQPDDIARAMISAWRTWPPGSARLGPPDLIDLLSLRRVEFGRRFARVCSDVLQRS